MCNFAAQLKDVAYREKPVEIQMDNTFRRETPELSKKARYKSKQQSAYYKELKFRMLSSTTNISNMTNLYNAQCT